MKKLFFAWAIMLLLASCSKEKNITTPATPQTEKNLVKSVRVYNGGAPETYEFSYDSQGRLVQYSSDNSTSEFTFPSATQIIKTNKNKSAGALENVTDYTVNADGRITRSVHKSPDGLVLFTTEFTYDKDGYIVSTKETNNGNSTLFEFTVSNGNYTQRKQYYNGNPMGTVTYTVDNTRICNGNYSPGGAFASKTLFGKPGRNPIVEVIATNNTGAITWHARNTVQTDSQGYMISNTTDYPLLGTQGKETFFYQ